MNNIYNAIQNLYNMDKTTWQEVLAELYNLVSKIDNKFDLFELKFGSLLGEQVTRELKKMYDDGSLASLINDKLLKDINTKVDTFKTEVSEQLGTKANLNSIFTMANMGQDVKEAMTGGSVAVVGVDAILEENIVNRQVTPNKTSFARKINEFNYLTSIEGKKLNYPNNNLTSEENFSVSDYIEVETGKYTLNIANYDTVFLYNNDKSLINKINLSGWGIKTNTIDIESNVKYIRLCYLTEHKNSIIFTKGEKLPTKYFSSNAVIIDNLNQDAFVEKITNDGLSGVYLFSGDSICYGAGFKGGYATLIANRNPNATIVNYGISGTKVAKIEGQTDSILERIETMREDADFIIFEGGVNDAWSSSIQLGDFNATAPITSNYINNLNEYTFSGALESLFNKAQNKWHGKKIFFIIPHNMDLPSTKTYMDRAEEICKKWSVILIDLRKLSGLNTYNEYMKKTYTNESDGVHPNELGYKEFYIKPIIDILIKYN